MPTELNTSKTPSPKGVGYILDAVRRLLADEIDYAAYQSLVPEDPDDDDVAELLSLVEHIPKREGFLGVSQSEFDNHMSQIDSVVARLAARNPTAL